MPMSSARPKLIAAPVACFALLVTSSALAQFTQPTNQPPPTTQPSSGGLESGGLAPPPPMQNGPSPGDQPQQPTPTERKLDEAERDDAGRGLEFFYFNVEGGFEQLGLQTFKSDGLTYANTTKTQDSGFMVGAGAGLRLVFLTIGARARLGKFSQWNVATLNGEFGIHIPLGDLEPYFTLGGGYAFLGAMDENNWGGSVSIKGYDIRGGFGLDYYVTPVFSVGGNLTGEVLGLTRPGVDLTAATSGTSQPSQLDAKSQEVAKADGSSMGAAFTASAVLGLHF